VFDNVLEKDLKAGGETGPGKRKIKAHSFKLYPYTIWLTGKYL
jgi:hypothetical protein